MANEIRIVITADDRASNTLNKVQREGTNLAATLDGKLTSSLNAGAGSLVKFGAAASGVYFGILGVSAVLGRAFNLAVTGAIEAASSLDESINKSRVVFGELSREIEALGESAPRSLGLSRQAAIEFAATFGNLFTSMGIGTEQSAEMSKSILKLAADLASFNNIPVAEALEKLRSGLVGEVEPLRVLGVNLTADAVAAEGLRLGLRKANEELTASGKAQAAYSLILQQTTNAQGDFERTSGGLANQQRILAGNIDTLQEKLGAALLPVMNDIVSRTNEWIELHGDEAAEAFARSVDIAVASVGNLAEALQALVNSSPFQLVVEITVRMGGVISDINNAAQEVGSRLSGAVEQAKATIQNAIPTIIDPRQGRQLMEDMARVATGQAPTPGGVLDQIKRAGQEPEQPGRAIGWFQGSESEGDTLPPISQRGGGIARTPGPTSIPKTGGAEKKDPLTVALERIADQLNKQLVDAYMEGGEAQVNAVRESQSAMMEQISATAGELVRILGIELPDAMTLAADAIIAQMKRWSDALDNIQTDFMHDQIAAYLKGGEGAVAATKASQQQLVDQAFVTAEAVRVSIGAPFAKFGEIALEVLEQISKKAEETKDEAGQSISGLLAFLVAKRVGEGRDSGLRTLGGQPLQLAMPGSTESTKTVTQNVDVGGITIVMPESANPNQIDTRPVVAGLQRAGLEALS